MLTKLAPALVLLIGAFISAIAGWSQGTTRVFVVAALVVCVVLLAWPHVSKRLRERRARLRSPRSFRQSAPPSPRDEDKPQPTPQRSEPRPASADPGLKSELERLEREGAEIRKHATSPGLVGLGRSPDQWEEQVKFVLREAGREGLEVQFSLARLSRGFPSTESALMPDRRKQMTQGLMELRNIIESL